MARAEDAGEGLARGGLRPRGRTARAAHQRRDRRARAEVDTTGRYRLDLVDQNNKPIEGAPSGYVQINFETQTTSTEAQSFSRPTVTTQSDNVVLEAMRMNAEITRTMVNQFPMMMEAAATLLRAADGAGLPSRLPRLIEMEDDIETADDNDGAIVAPAGFDLNALVAQLVPMLVTGLMSGKVKVPGLAAMFDWRKARPAAEPTTHEEHASAAKPARIAAPAASDISRPLGSLRARTKPFGRPTPGPERSRLDLIAMAIRYG